MQLCATYCVRLWSECIFTLLLGKALWCQRKRGGGRGRALRHSACCWIIEVQGFSALTEHGQELMSGPSHSPLFVSFLPLIFFHVPKFFLSNHSIIFPAPLSFPFCHLFLPFLVVCCSFPSLQGCHITGQAGGQCVCECVSVFLGFWWASSAHAGGWLAEGR